jgi:hypothetical protein
MKWRALIMIDLSALLTSMAQALQRPGPLDWSQIALTLGLDLRNARFAGVGKPASAMSGARLIAGNLVVGGTIFEEPIREIALMFPDSAIRDANIAAVRFGSDQRIEPSRAGDGYAIVSEIGEVEGSVLISGPDAVIQGLMVRRRATPAKHGGRQGGP